MNSNRSVYSTTTGHPGPALIASTTLSTPRNSHELAEIRALLAKLKARRRQYRSKIRSRIELNKEVYHNLAYSRQNIHVMDVVTRRVEFLNEISVDFEIIKAISMEVMDRVERLYL